MTPLRILVVDDASVYRKIVRESLATIPGVEVVGVASTGTMALDAIQNLRPDLVTLDIEMPELDGLSVLRELKRRRLPSGVIMLSSLTTQGADLTMQALRSGAFDFISKPGKSSWESNVTALRSDLIEKIAAFRKSRAINADMRLLTAARQRDRRSSTERMEIVAIGVSTGGPTTLASLLPKLPADFPAPIVIVQHMPPIFTKSLASDLNRICELEVCEATGGEHLCPGQVLIAPGGQQMRLERTTAGVTVRITNDPPEKSCKPSVDYLFRSVAEVYGRRALGLIMTGMGDDGALGCQAIKSVGGKVLAQDQSSCVVFGMPRAVIDRGLVDAIIPLGELPEQLIGYAAMPALNCRA